MNALNAMIKFNELESELHALLDQKEKSNDSKLDRAIDEKNKELINLKHRMDRTPLAL